MKKLILTNLLLIIAFTMFGRGEGRYNPSDFFNEMQAGDKAAILMVHFGSTHADTRQLTIDVLNEKAKQAFPELEVREAYTSRIVIKRLGEIGIKKQKPTEALKQLYTEGYTHILVQTSAVIDGVEVESLNEDVDEVRSLFKEIRVGDPLLYTPQDYEQVIDVLTKNTDKKTAYILVGHGTYDSTTAQYAMLDYMLKAKGHSNFFVGTIEGYPELDNVLQQLKTTQLKNVVLIPFLFVAGEHAKNDIAIDWKEELEKSGYTTQVRMESLGQDPQIQDLYIEHLRFAVSHQKININDKKKVYEQTFTLPAQEKNMTDTIHTLSEVIVQGKTKTVEVGKMNIPLQILPITVSTISAKTLEIRGITNIQDAVKFLPGVRMNTGYGAFQTLTVRGFGYTPITIDGVRDERTMINSYPFSDLTSIESMELLKGPASVLYGHSVLGGVLNIVRKSPIPATVFNAKMSYGSWDSKQANIDFGGKLAGPINYRTNFFYADEDGWRHTGNKRLSGYLALGGKIDATSSIDVRGGINRDWYGTEIGLPSNMMFDTYNADGSLYLKAGEMQPGLNREARYNNESDFFKNNGWNIMGKYEKKFSEKIKLTNLLSFKQDDINYFGTEELSYLESTEPIYNHYYKMGDVKQYICLDTVALTYPLRFSHVANMLTDELDLSGVFNTGEVKHNYMGGYTFSQMFRNSYTGYNLAPDDDPTNSSYDVYGPGLYSHVPVHNPHSMGYMESSFSKAVITKDYSHGIYIQDLIELNEKFKLLLAGRYDYYKYMRSGANTYDGERQYHKSEQTPSNIAENSAFTYRAGLVYLPLPELSVYASVASYFRPDRTFPSATAIYIDKNGKEFVPMTGEGAFDPEEGYQTEIGTRYSYKNILKASASVFYIQKNNVVRGFGRTIVGQNEDGSAIYKTVYGQIGSEASKGFDLELTVTPVYYASLSFGYGYTDVKTLDVTENPYITTDPQGLTLVPKNTFYSYGSVAIPKSFLKGLSLNYSLSFMDKVNRDYAGTLTYPSYWLTDAGVSYPLKGGIRLSLNINNVFDEKYYNQAIGYQMVPSMPRNYLFSIAYSLK